MIALEAVAIIFAVYIAGVILADWSGFATIAGSAVRALAVLSLAYLAMVAAIT